MVRKVGRPARSNTEVRDILLRYFYDRNNSATSARGKRGFAVKISDVRKDLKASQGLSQQEVVGNINYLMSQGWIAEEQIQKSVALRSGTVIPQSTSFYKITAAGIDKIDGPGDFTMPKFHGIKIEATGQNVITLGDGNQINAQFGELGKALAELREAVVKSEAGENDKMGLVADIDTVQSQLAKPQPNRGIVSAAWAAVKGAATLNGCAGFVEHITGLIAPLLT
jgi:hypothetical protein